MTKTITRVPEQRTGSTIRAGAYCANCGSPVVGAFCTACGTPTGVADTASLTTLQYDPAARSSFSNIASRLDHHRRRVALVGSLMTAAVIGSGVGLAVTAGGSTVDLHGTMMIASSTDSALGENFESDGSSCSGTDGYSDLGPGAEVTIHDPRGAVIATGYLESEGPAANGIGCFLKWRIANVPKETFYGVEITHRGTVDFKSSEIQGGFDTTIGD